MCPCSKECTVDHAMQCPTGGFLLQRHKDVKYTIVKLLDQTCRDVEVEPPLTPLTGERGRRRRGGGGEGKVSKSKMVDHFCSIAANFILM